MVFHALANSARRKIIARLSEESATISELAEPFDMSLAAISKNIKVLEKAGFVIKQREGTTYRCHLNYAPVRSAAALIQYLEQRQLEEEELVVA